MKKTIITLSTALLTATLLLATTNAKEGGNAIEFTTSAKQDSTNSMLMSTTIAIPKKANFVAGNYYFFNSVDNVKIQPVVGETDGKKFIQVVGDANTDNLGNGTGYLIRYVKIPANAPKEIALSFDVKLDKGTLTGWETGASKPSDIRLFFMKGDRTGNVFFSTRGGEQGNGSIPVIPSQWTTEKITAAIPQGAEYLVISINVQKSDKLSLANWTIF